MIHTNSSDEGSATTRAILSAHVDPRDPLAGTEKNETAERKMKKDVPAATEAATEPTAIETGPATGTETGTETGVGMSPAIVGIGAMERGTVNVTATATETGTETVIQSVAGRELTTMIWMDEIIRGRNLVISMTHLHLQAHYLRYPGIVLAVRIAHQTPATADGMAAVA